jgi:hypothetical protein
MSKTYYSFLNNDVGSSIAILSSKRYTSINEKCGPSDRPEVIQYLSSMFPAPIKVPEQAKLFQPQVANQGR